MLHGSINHVSVTVSGLDSAMEFMAPFLELLGYSIGEVLHDRSSGTRLTLEQTYRQRGLVASEPDSADTREVPPTR